MTPKTASATSSGGRYGRNSRVRPSVAPAAPSLLPETRDRMCPSCRTRAVVARGPVTAGASGIRCAYGCAKCGTEFVLVFSMRRMIETEWSTPGAP